MPCLAQVMLSEQLQHYSVKAYTEEQLIQALAQHSPVVLRERTFHGGTQWNLTPQFALQVRGNLCYVTAIEVSLNGVYTLPQLANPSSVPPMLANKFNRFYQGLMDHERGHQSLWLEAGQKIHQELSSLPAQMHCSVQSKLAKQRVRSIVEEYKKHNEDYDKETRFGTTQGASIRSLP